MLLPFIAGGWEWYPSSSGVAVVGSGRVGGAAAGAAGGVRRAAATAAITAGGGGGGGVGGGGAAAATRSMVTLALRLRFKLLEKCKNGLLCSR